MNWEKNKKIIEGLIVIIVIFAIANSARGEWNTKPASAPSNNPVEFVDIGSNGQIKDGFLYLNYNGATNLPGTAPAGLIVFGDSTNGKVGIGTITPTEKLEVAGNLNITKTGSNPDGVIIANDTIGNWASKDSILRKYDDGLMYWSSPVEWLTLTGTHSAALDCSGGSIPASCSDLGYKEYKDKPGASEICVSDTVNNYSYWARNCYK
ncbi:MAG: hypothetical protein EXS49_01880 [Candidatus Pacebacteria bacterium]|nr:hypothetical protein [Candidatus Paceibacterota bacterium]